MRMRSIFRGALAFLAASFMFMALPASAAQPDNGYQISQDVFFVFIVADAPAYSVIEEVAQVPIDVGGALTHSIKPMKLLSNVYATSMLIDGQTLTGYHCRC